MRISLVGPSLPGVHFSTRLVKLRTPGTNLMIQVPAQMPGTVLRRDAHKMNNGLKYPWIGPVHCLFSQSTLPKMNPNCQTASSLDGLFPPFDSGATGEAQLLILHFPQAHTVKGFHGPATLAAGPGKLKSTQEGMDPRLPEAFLSPLQWQGPQKS